MLGVINLRRSQTNDQLCDPPTPPFAKTNNKSIVWKNRIRKHVTNFKISTARGRHKCKVPYSYLTVEIVQHAVILRIRNTSLEDYRPMY